MKYIDSEKLKAEIEQLIKVNKELTPRDFTQGIAAGYADVLSSIKSLEQEQSTIKGWVARDRDNALFCHENKPRRTFGHTIGGERIEYWCNGGKRFELSQELIPEISWLDEPIEIELIIRKI